MPKNLTRHRRAAKRGGQTAEAPAPYVAPAPAPMPTYAAPAAPAEEEDGGVFGKLKGFWSSGTTAISKATGLSTGGRKRMRAMRGGNVDASAPLSLATNASPISGISSARAHNWVGGRTRAQKRSQSRSQRRSRAQSRSRSQGRSRKYRRTRH
jgi:hypothetical protein